MRSAETEAQPARPSSLGLIQFLKIPRGLADRIRRLETRVEELSSQEQLLKKTLMSAKAMNDEMAQNAEREAELRLAEAELRA